MAQHTIIANQLGGYNRLSVMVGAKYFFNTDFDSNPGLAFTFSGSRVANKCSVTINGDDTYTVKFLKAHGTKCAVKGTFENVYSDQLTTVFEQFTKLRLSL